MITTTPAIFEALAAVPVLAGTDHQTRQLLAEESRVRDFADGSWIVREGEEGHSFFILLEGGVDLIKSADTPQACLLYSLVPGDLFGEMCLVEPMPRPVSIRSVGHVRVIEIRAMSLYRLFQQRPDQYAIVLLNVARDMARQLRRMDEAFVARAG